MALLRAVFYCRCSTEEESQVDALKKQVLESEACIREQGWFLADRYVELKSGTTTRGRNEYNRLYEDLLVDKFDVIVIKSQDRLMRNVKDWYLFLDRMLTQGKRLFMYLERKFYTTDDALITGIKAILAEEYSRELSKKMNNAHHNRQKNGGKTVLNSRVFGFCKNPDGTLIVVEEEAEIIRKIYAYCAAGYGSRAIANIFYQQGYVKRTGNVLTAGAVRKIIRNPLYMGTMVMNRRHFDFETKRTRNLPKEEWICRRDMVPAIVSRVLWEQANQAMDERAEKFRHVLKDTCMPFGSNKENLKKIVIGRYDLSGKLVCANCGKPYYRTQRCRYKDKEDIVIEWKCSNYLEKGRKRSKCTGKEKKAKKEILDGCDNVHLEEATVFSLLEQISGQYYSIEQDKDSIIRHAVQILQKALRSGTDKRGWEQLQKEEERVNQQKEFLLTKFLEGVIADKDYRKKDDELEENLADLQKRKDTWKQREWENKSLEQRIEQIKTRLEKGGVEKAAVMQMLEDMQNIRVHEWQLELCFEPLRVSYTLPGTRELMSFQDGAGLHPTRYSSKADQENTHLLQDIVREEFSLWVDYPFSPETERGRYLDRRKIMEQIKKNPSATAKCMAKDMGRSVYMVRNRIVELTRGGYLRFNGRGGRGAWEIVKELPEKETVFRDGGL